MIVGMLVVTVLGETNWNGWTDALVVVVFVFVVVVFGIVVFFIVLEALAVCETGLVLLDRALATILPTSIISVGT
jgi:hypothetical protein